MWSCETSGSGLLKMYGRTLLRIWPLEELCYFLSIVPVSRGCKPRELTRAGEAARPEVRPARLRGHFGPSEVSNPPQPTSCVIFAKQKHGL